MGDVEVTSTGPLNIVYKILSGGAAGFGGKAAYAEIAEIVKAAEQKRASHPFEIGDQFKAIRREYPDANSFKCVTTEINYEIMKASDTTIRLQAVGTDEKPITRKPVQTFGGKWRFSIDDTMGNTFYKEDKRDIAAESAVPDDAQNEEADYDEDLEP